ncbi:hypothetical protein CH063_13062 [Colletotrichum higginsianum]|uniref:Uncharacterized protein n=1 Tax=Colletotrichum higginsianum (strain IMI 349063) TaxID=759273 RepID=H1VSX1_COLHI|nr:hypothetical protein CH063_13062 [Colletotrichum higginsianum]
MSASTSRLPLANCSGPCISSYIVKIHDLLINTTGTWHSSLCPAPITHSKGSSLSVCSYARSIKSTRSRLLGCRSNWKRFGWTLNPSTKSYSGGTTSLPRPSLALEMSHPQASSATLRFRLRSAMLMPWHIRRPWPKAENCCRLGYTLSGSLKVGYRGSSQRSGLKSSGSGYSSGSRWIAHCTACTTVPLLRK